MARTKKSITKRQQHWLAHIKAAEASTGTLAYITISKYADGQPLYRQEQGLKRIGVELPRSTCANWMIKAGNLVQPIINLVSEHMLSYPVLAMDEKRIQELICASPCNCQSDLVRRNLPR